MTRRTSLHLASLAASLALMLGAPLLGTTTAHAQSGPQMVPRISVEPGELTFDKAGDLRTVKIKTRAPRPCRSRACGWAPRPTRASSWIRWRPAASSPASHSWPR